MLKCLLITQLIVTEINKFEYDFFLNKCASSDLLDGGKSKPYYVTLIIMLFYYLKKKNWFQHQKSTQKITEKCKILVLQ